LTDTYSDRPWLALRRGKAVTEMWLAQQLRPYGVHPKTIWIGETAAKGYLEADFEETFRRYIPKSAVITMQAQMKEAQQTRPAEKPADKPREDANAALKNIIAAARMLRPRHS
jgi:uncharacterized protein DUF3631